ncbi:MAG: dihydrolipoyl dehydrogenase [Trichloromonadaceae bacterium]
MTTDPFDLIVIGAGPGGYVAALRASRLGQKVAMIERRATFGGVCLNEGCIPSKALLDSSELLAMARDDFAAHGIDIEPPRLNLPQMLQRKEELVAKLCSGIAAMFKQAKIVSFLGTGRLLPPSSEGAHQVEFSDAEGKNQNLKAKRVLLATGSRAIELPNLPCDGESVVTARETLSFAAVPKHLLVVGGGYIGLELGSVWRRLGAEVTVAEMLPRLLPFNDAQGAELLQRRLKKSGMTILLETRVTGLSREGSELKVQLQRGEKREELVCDKVLVAVGRRPWTEGLGLEEAGVALDSKGRVQVDADYQTSLPGVYAIGDLIPGPMLAHKASAEGTVFAERLAGQASSVDYANIPGVIYTWPELASVGRTEEQLKQAGIPFSSGKAHFSANGRARALGETDGFTKILAAPGSGRILGVHIIGPRASELIAEAAAVMAFEGSVQDLALICHAHPTLAEVIHEAALAAVGGAS